MFIGFFFPNIKRGRQYWKVLNIEIDKSSLKWALKKIMNSQLRLLIIDKMNI